MKLTPRKIESHYRNLLLQHGDTPAAAQYSSQKSQERRFFNLMRIGNLEGMRILDFGSGSGHLATYIKNHSISVEYTGVDIVPEFFIAGKEKHPQHRFGLLEEFIGEKFDYVFISGVFNNKRNNNRKFYQESLIELFSLCEKGLAFNMMSKYVDYEDKELFYEKPENAFGFVKRNLTPFVNLIHDYKLKAESIPFEFCIHAMKESVL